MCNLSEGICQEAETCGREKREKEILEAIAHNLQKEHPELSLEEAMVQARRFIAEAEYVAGVKKTLQDELNLSADEVDRAVVRYELIRRLHDAPDIQMHTDYKDVLADMQRKGLLPMRREPRKRSLEESKRWYLAAVRGFLVAHYGFMEEEANRIMDAYKLQERLNVAPEAQIHMDIEDAVKEMRREGFFSRAFGESGIDVNFIDIGEA